MTTMNVTPAVRRAAQAVLNLDASLTNDEIVDTAIGFANCPYGEYEVEETLVRQLHECWTSNCR